MRSAGQPCDVRVLSYVHICFVSWCTLHIHLHIGIADGTGLHDE